MKRHLTLAVAAMVVASVAGTAVAKPVQLTVDSTLSKLTVKLSGTINGQPVTGGSSTGIASLTLQGTPPDRTYDPDGTGPLGTVTQPTGLVGDLADGPGPAPKPPGTLTTTVPTGFHQPVGAVSTLSVRVLGIPLSATLRELHASLSPGTLVPVSSTGGPTGSSQYDLVGQSLTIDGGLAVLSAGNVEVFNFFNDPAAITIPAGLPNVTVSWDSLAPASNRPVTLALPLNINTTLLDVVTLNLLGNTVTLTLNLTLAFLGDIVMKGTRIPEPQTMVLLGIGLMGLVPVVRKRLRR